MLPLLAALLLPADAAPKPVFRAGAFAQNITPTKFPISVNGNFSDFKATAATDPLHARCLVLDDGETRLALVVVDSCMIPRTITDEAKRLAAKATGIPASHVLISATHCHSAPAVTGVFGSEPDADYVKLLPVKIADGIAAAFKARVPAEIGFGTASNARQLFNRRWYRDPTKIPMNPFGGKGDLVQMNPGYRADGLTKQAGTVDPTVSVLSVRTLAGKPLAVYANYGLHYVGGVKPLSADYFGMFADRMRANLAADEKSPFVAMISNGASGDVNNVDFANAAPKARASGEQARVVAEDVAKSAMEAYRAIKHVPHLRLAAATEELTLKVRKPTAAEVKRANFVLAALDSRAPSGAVEVYARETTLMAKYPDEVKAVVQAMRIGHVGIHAIPCEVFAEIGLALRETSPFEKSFTVSLANGYNGYLPTPEQHRLGGYETWRARSSYLEVEASGKIAAALGRLAKKVR